MPTREMQASWTFASAVKQTNRSCCSRYCIRQGGTRYERNSLARIASLSAFEDFLLALGHFSRLH
jgi:hypothetical protein